MSAEKFPRRFVNSAARWAHTYKEIATGPDNRKNWQDIMGDLELISRGKRNVKW